MSTSRSARTAILSLRVTPAEARRLRRAARRSPEGAVSPYLYKLIRTGEAVVNELRPGELQRRIAAGDR